jgi:hypothetical protein
MAVRALSTPINFYDDAGAKTCTPKIKMLDAICSVNKLIKSIQRKSKWKLNINYPRTESKKMRGRKSGPDNAEFVLEGAW